MIREVNLVSYLPEFMQAYAEPVAALEGENPEFDIMWEAIDKTLCNRFISTADEYGISRFEKMLGLYPAHTDDLETRRVRVFNRWFNMVPYTIRTLTNKLKELLGNEYSFSLQRDFVTGYHLTVRVFSLKTQMNEEIKYLLETIVPVNISVSIIYEKVIEGTIYVGGIMSEADIIEIKQR